MHTRGGNKESIRANEYLLKSLLKLIPNPFFRILIVSWYQNYHAKPSHFSTLGSLNRTELSTSNNRTTSDSDRSKGIDPAI